MLRNHDTYTYIHVQGSLPSLFFIISFTLLLVVLYPESISCLPHFITLHTKNGNSDCIESGGKSRQGRSALLVKINLSLELWWLSETMQMSQRFLANGRGHVYDYTIKYATTHSLPVLFVSYWSQQRTNQALEFVGLG
jgi:hypothetical protein